MRTFHTPRFRAEQYHRRLPAAIRRALTERGMSDAVIERYLLGWNGKRITIPITDREGDVAFFRFAKSPDDRTPGPEVLTEVGAEPELYGWDALASDVDTVIVCENELERLVLESHAYRAVSSAAGADVFLPEWAEELARKKRVFICFSRNPASRTRAKAILEAVPNARLVTFPPEVAEKDSVSDFFGRLGRTRVDFEHLLASAMADTADMSSSARPEEARGKLSIETRRRRVAAAVPIEKIVEWYTDLAPEGEDLVGVCPFHTDPSLSFVVNPRMGSYFCFACEEGGDVVNLLMRKESLTEGQAIARLEEYRYDEDGG